MSVTDKNRRRPPSSPISDDIAPKKIQIDDVLKMTPDELQGILTDVVKSGAISEEKSSKLIAAVNNLVSFTSGVINGKSEFVLEAVREERRQRTAVISMRREPLVPIYNETPDQRAFREVDSDKREQSNVETMVKFMGVREKPIAIHRISPFLVKVEFASRSGLRGLLANKKKLVGSCWNKVFIRESLPQAERDRYKELKRQRAYLEEVEPRKWVLYANSLRLRENIKEDKTMDAPKPPDGWFPKTTNSTPMEN